MGLLSGRAQKPIPADARAVLARIPDHFVDDGCSNSPDSWFGFNFRWACRIHDWRYCTRCHAPGTMTYNAKLVAEDEIKDNIKASLPLRWRWVRFVYYGAVFTLGGFGAFDTCGRRPAGASDGQLEAGLCRHGMPMPEWMKGLP